MKKLFCVLLNLIILFFLTSNKAILAIEEPKILSCSAEIESKNKTNSSDKRVAVLKNFLKGYPLEKSAESFVKIGDKYNLGKHVYLVAAISGVESTFGMYIPYGSYNAWGFGIPTGAQSGIVFNSWEDGIEEVTKTLRTGYLKNVKNVEDLSTEELVYFIGPIYAASPTWASKVLYFMQKIENTPATPSAIAHLPLDF